MTPIKTYRKYLQRKRVAYTVNGRHRTYAYESRVH